MKLNPNTILFVLDGEIKEIEFCERTGYKPTTTVLNYLRSLKNHNGVKEGCAEGDCGACTVVIADAIENKLRYRAIDSCLYFLPALHGKQLITVENLSFKENNKIHLHPVQKQIVEQYGTQCGYCTPGIVMSMFALYKNHRNADEETIKDALTGNLCRCTGYKPILQAAINACKGDDNDHFTKDEDRIVGLLNAITDESDTVNIYNGIQRYFLPTSLQEALFLKKHYPYAILIKGATDVALRQTKKNEILKELIDLTSVKELNFIEEAEDGLVVGATATLEEVKNICSKYLPALHKLLSRFASLQIRNVATLSGNVGSASPIGDTIPLLMAYGASVIIHNEQESREIPIKEFITGYRKTVLRSDEIITMIAIPKPTPDTIVKCYKVSKRKTLDISTVNAAFSLTLEENVVKNIIPAFGGMASRTIVAEKTASFLKGKKWEKDVILEACDILYSEFTPLSDARSGEEYRRLIARNLLLKFYLESRNN